MKKLLVITIMSLFAYGNLYSQQATEYDDEDPTEETIKQRKNAIGVSFGVVGLGVEYARKINDDFVFRVRYNTLEINEYELKDFDLNGENTDIITNLKNQSFDFLIEYQPFTSSSFKLVFGAGYFSDFLISGLINFKKEVKVGDIVIADDDFGDLKLAADWTGSFAPYLGIGFGRAIPKKRLGLSIEIGAYYTGSPDVTLEATRLLTPTEEENRETIQKAFQSYNFIPHIKLKLAYNF